MFTVHEATRPDADDAGPPVWLLHGAFADHHLWDAVVPLLDGPVVTVDQPGHGSGPRIDALPPLDEQADRLGDLVAAHAGSPVVLAGHSWGGMVALRLAARRPDVVRGLFLTNTPLLGGDGRGFALQRLVLRAGVPLGAFGRIAARSLYGAPYRRAHPEVVAATGRTVARLGRRGTLAVVRRVLVEPGDAVDLLTGLRMPVALVAGVDDYVGGPEVRQRLDAVGRQLELVPGGHMGPAEAPAEVAAALRRLVGEAAAG